MTQKTDKEIKKAYIGKRLRIVGEHPHKGRLVRVLDYDKPDGCAEYGLLVIRLWPRNPKERVKFRVWDLNNVEFVLHNHKQKP